MWPLPSNLGELLKGFKKVLVPEMNKGQFATVLRDNYLVDAVRLNQVNGQPFKVSRLTEVINGLLD
jgi:2-oxoglutarate ferredoxin oxidoreductase subunit alpha